MSKRKRHVFGAPTDGHGTAPPPEAMAIPVAIAAAHAALTK
jgi:hypothetical protein